MAYRPDEAYWEVTAAGTPRTSAQRAILLSAAPPTACDGSGADVVSGVAVTRDGAALRLAFTNAGVTTAPAAVSFCVNVTVAPVAPIPGGEPWPTWRTAAAAMRFSAIGVATPATAPDGGVSFASAQPVWEDGATAAGTNEFTIGYPYRTAYGTAATRVSVSSPWVGMLSTVRTPDTLQGAGGRLYDGPPPPPAMVAPPVAASAAPPAISTLGIALVSVSAALVVLAALLLLWVCMARRAAAAVVVESKKSDTRTALPIVADAHGVPKATPGSGAPAPHAAFRGRSIKIRLLTMVLLPCVATACSDARAAACDTCSGVLMPSTCLCECGWSQSENVALALILFPAVTMMLLYV